jgi:hypothetical protein
MHGPLLADADLAGLGGDQRAGVVDRPRRPAFADLACGRFQLPVLDSVRRDVAHEVDVQLGKADGYLPLSASSGPCMGPLQQ